MHPLLILLVAVIAVFLLIIRYKINAFAALILCAILIGVLSPQVPIDSVMGEVTTRASATSSAASAWLSPWPRSSANA